MLVIHKQLNETTKFVGGTDASKYAKLYFSDYIKAT